VRTGLPLRAHHYTITGRPLLQRFPK
jgi:hypothetical protein